MNPNPPLVTRAPVSSSWRTRSVPSLLAELERWMVLYRRPPSQKSFGGRQPPIGLGFAMDLVRLIGKRDFVRHCGTRIDPANHACMLQPFLERGSRGMGF